MCGCMYDLWQKTLKRKRTFKYRTIIYKSLQRFISESKDTVLFGYLFIQVKAEDIDTGENARLRYALLDDANGKFSIDPITGDVISEGELKAMEQFQLRIQVNKMDVFFFSIFWIIILPYTFQQNYLKLVQKVKKKN